ncbi:MAG: efflux RND transporter periplasmic adaptor subunit [Candidatus Dadabacteria bacterium]|nr:efflux RND transporter periplasmic adaptor subunit [Candidatus Dadabacteria bacterium]
MMIGKMSLKPKIKNALLITLVSILLVPFTSCGKEGEPDDEKEMHHDTTSNLIQLNSKSIEAANLEIEEVSLRSLKNILQVPGKVQFNENRLAHVGSRVPGRIVEVRANLGDNVKEGDSLAIIDSTELGTAQSEYLKAKANLLAQEKSYQRAKRLLEGKAISLGEYQRREAEYMTVRAEFRAAEDRLHLLGLSEEEVKRIGSEHIINSKVAVRAPFPGTLVERHATLGEVIEPAAKLFILADLSTLWFIADVPEKDIPLLKTGLSVEIKVSPYPNEVFKGAITYIGDQIDPSTRTVKVRTEVDNSLGKLKPEMFATIFITTDLVSDVLAIPEEAVQTDGNKKIVFVNKGNGGFERREVALGRQFDSFYQVVNGVKAGEKIVTKGSFLLKSEAEKDELGEEHH